MKDGKQPQLISERVDKKGIENKKQLSQWLFRGSAKLPDEQAEPKLAITHSSCAGPMHLCQHLH